MCSSGGQIPLSENKYAYDNKTQWFLLNKWRSGWGGRSLRPQVLLNIFQMNTFGGMWIIIKYSVAVQSDFVYQAVVFSDAES